MNWRHTKQKTENKNVLVSDGPKLSVIIPVYNTENYLERCLDSVINQLYGNLEIIIVDDGSTDNSEKIIKRYADADSRIKCQNHLANRGLFQARLTGSKIATGDFIAFLDSDDYISQNHYYSMMTKAEETKADIVIGRTVLETENGEKSILHFHDRAIFQNEVLNKREIEEKFWSFEGRCYAWHTIWNKIYSKGLWDKAAPFYEKIQNHLIMTEDLAFSSVLVHFAEKMVTTDNSAYFYCERNDASTNNRVPDINKYKKNVNDIVRVFDFVEDFLNSQAVSDNIKKHEQSFRAYYYKMWHDTAKFCYEGDERKCALRNVQKLKPSSEIEIVQDEKSFFESLRTPWEDKMEQARMCIINPSIKYVSFDIFDTLIVRPFYAPSQLFTLLNEYYAKLSGDSIEFSKIRSAAENIARKRINDDNAAYEDVTLDEIYQTIESILDIPKEIIQQVKEREIELELKLCYRRESVGELYNLAKRVGKKIILISDMYLSKEIMEELLHKNGYSGYEKLYVSSDTRKLKYNGKIYRHVLHDLGINANEIIHFGDNVVNDLEKAKENGIESFYIPSAISVFEGKIYENDTNHCASLERYAAGWICEPDSYKKSIGYGAMMAVVAQHYFDNPYRLFCKDSDLNADPYFIGYYLIGMHLFGVVKWLIKESMRAGYTQLCFLARDGYLPFIIYQKMSVFFENAPKAIYKHTSRKAMMPYIIKTANDIFDYPTVFRVQTPLSMLKLLDFCSKEIETGEFSQLLQNEGIAPDAMFLDESEYFRFINFFIRTLYDEKKHKAAQELCTSYFSGLDSNTAMFDMGYSARIQGAISEAIGHGVDVFFVHSDNNHHLFEEHTKNFHVHTYYDFSPACSGLFREYLFSGTQQSCVGYKKINEQVTCVFEKENSGVEDIWINTEIQRGAEAFIDDLINVFGEDIELLPIKPHEVSLPYEGFLRRVSDMDLRVFDSLYFDDVVWSGNKKISVAEFIRTQKEQLGDGEVLVKEVDGRYVAKVKKFFNHVPWIKYAAERVLDAI